MSRFALICSLVFGLSSTSLVSTVDAGFAKAPPAAAATATFGNAGSTGTAGTAATGTASNAATGLASNAAAGTASAAAAMRIAPARALDRAAVRRALAKARATNLAAFRTYQAKGTFPSNTFTTGKANVWLDRDGNFCAAATLIKMSGNDDLASKVAEQNNFIRLASVTQGPLMDWILTSGFTQDEIAAIQEPFMPVQAEPAPAPILANGKGDILVGGDEPVATVDAKKRKAEDARLRAKYKAVDRMLVKNARKNLDKAVDRLMKNPQLAAQLIDAQT